MCSCFGLYLAMCYAYCFILEPSKFCHPKDGKALVMNLQVVSLLSVVVATSGVKITDYHERLARLTNNMKIDASKTHSHKHSSLSHVFYRPQMYVRETLDP